MYFQKLRCCLSQHWPSLEREKKSIRKTYIWWWNWAHQWAGIFSTKSIIISFAWSSCVNISPQQGYLAIWRSVPLSFRRHFDRGRHGHNRSQELKFLPIAVFLPSGLALIKPGGWVIFFGSRFIFVLNLHFWNLAFKTNRVAIRGQTCRQKAYWWSQWWGRRGGCRRGSTSPPPAVRTSGTKGPPKRVPSPPSVKILKR